MLDAYIIDAIRREQEERERAFEGRRIHLELPLHQPDRSDRPTRDEQPDPYADRGPIVIPFHRSGDEPEEDAA